MLELQQKINATENLLARLNLKDSAEEKVQFLLENDAVKAFITPAFLNWIAPLSDHHKFLLLAPIALGQGPSLFDTNYNIDPGELLTLLGQVDCFYATIGGIIGYHLAVLNLLFHTQEVEKQVYLQPLKIDIRKGNPEVHRAIRSGIEQLGQLAELYPVGGAGDRLALICPEEFEPLPAAQLPFCGVTLLEGLFRDLQAREYLHYKLTGNQVITPVALMTSHEKANDQRIAKILEENQHFGRPATSVRQFKQPMVPVMTEKGDWVVEDKMKPMLKPGGHGAVWRLAIHEGIFDWFQAQGRTKGLVRQINNPIAGIDYGLLAFTGIGTNRNKSFGFAACPRLINSAEGTDVLVETKDENGYSYTLSNIEYTEFKKRGIEDISTESDDRYSAFPANTNILFFDIEAIRNAVVINPIPGMILNMKNKMTIDGEEVGVGRLESTMQNISDSIVDHFETKLQDDEFHQMRVYLTYNERRKTLSVAKNAYDPKKSAIGTPEGCFYEWMQNMVDLLSEHCKMTLPKLPDLQTYLKEGPNFNVHYHPALGPMFEIIGQKIRGGSLAAGSEIILHIAELDLLNVNIDGSLIINADQIVGHFDERNTLRYSSHTGKCTMLNCTVINEGIDSSAANYYWKQEISRKEVLEIHLQGNAEFFAENITFKGDYLIEVPNGHKMIASEKNGEVVFALVPLSKQSWVWSYAFKDNNMISLQKL